MHTSNTHLQLLGPISSRPILIWIFYDLMRLVIQTYPINNHTMMNVQSNIFPKPSKTGGNHMIYTLFGSQKTIIIFTASTMNRLRFQGEKFHPCRSGLGRSWTPEDPCCNLAFLSARPHIYKAPHFFCWHRPWWHIRHMKPEKTLTIVDPKFVLESHRLRTLVDEPKQYDSSLYAYFFFWMFWCLNHLQD